MKSKSNPDTSPDPETRRQLMAEAADRRLQAQESRGIKDVDKLKRKEEVRKKLEEKQQASSPNRHTPLQWTAN